MRTLLFSLLAFTTGCASSSRISSSWQAADMAPVRPEKVLVFGVVRTGDTTLEQRMEQHFAGDLRAAGYKAFPASGVYGSARFAGKPYDDVYRQLLQDSVDAVVTITLQGAEEEVATVDQRVKEYQQRPFWTLREEPVALPQTVSYTRMQWESNAYDLRSRKLVYSVRTETFEPASSERLAHEYGNLITKHLLATGVFGKP